MQNLNPVSGLFDRNPHVGWTVYAENMAEVKNFKQWQARALAVGVPTEAIHALKGPVDTLRLVALRFLYLSVAGDVITADLRNRDHFIHAEAEDYLSQ